MFGFTVPVEPPALPALIAQAPASTAALTQRGAQTITFCRDKESLITDSAFNSFSPISVEFLRQIGAKHGVADDKLKPYRVTLATPPQHGQVRLVHGPSHHWSYAPTEGYVGADRVIYQVEKEGKHYKVIVNFWVVEVIDEGRKIQECESIKFALLYRAFPAYLIRPTSQFMS